MGLLGSFSGGYQSANTDFLSEIASTKRPIKWTAGNAGSFSSGTIPGTGQLYLSGTTALAVLTTPLSEGGWSIGLRIGTGDTLRLCFSDSSAGQNPLNSGNNAQVSFIFNALNGTISAYRDGSLTTPNGTLLGTSANNVFSPNVRFTVEFQVKINSSTGIVLVQVNSGSGSPITALNLTGQNTQESSNATYDTYAIGASNSYIDGGCFFWDMTTSPGPVAFNAPIGNFAVYWCPPAGAGTNAQFGPVPNTNANYQNVNQRYDGDTTYNANAGIVGNKDSFAITPLPSNVAPLAIQPIATQRQDSAGTLALATVIKSGGTYALGDNVVGGSNYATQAAVYTQDPNGDITLTAPNVNAMEVGYQETA